MPNREGSSLQQMTLDGVFLKAQGPCTFLRKIALKRVAEFIVCDDQSLSVANKPMFRNCLVAMCPNATKADLPSTHDVTTYIHNKFSEFLDDLNVLKWWSCVNYSRHVVS
ncbi:hypothetical protein OG21DRAFT_1526024 [Imleria badia]|nr:hypothetical protein OG21DRAFT_1526024 [Imleria badia]